MYITTPFLSGLCYGPVHLRVYYPWTFVGMVHLIHLLPLLQPSRVRLLLLPSTGVVGVVGHKSSYSMRGYCYVLRSLGACGVG